jgi:hypothetical protein
MTVEATLINLPTQLFFPSSQLPSFPLFPLAAGGKRER